MPVADGSSGVARNAASSVAVGRGQDEVVVRDGGSRDDGDRRSRVRVEAHGRNGSYTGSWMSETSRPERPREADAVLDVLVQPPHVGVVHQLADELARLRPPERVLHEERQHPVRGLDQQVLRLVARGREQHPLVRHARAVVDPVVDREAVAEILEHGAARRARDQAEARDDQALVEHLHQEDLLLERVGLERHVRELVEVRVALAHAARLRDELQPALGVARLVLHHRRVVELRLGVGRDREELGRHLDGELVGLQLLRDHRPPEILAARELLRRARVLGHRRQLAPRQVARLPFGALRELVEPHDARERRAIRRAATSASCRRRGRVARRGNRSPSRPTD